MASFSVAKGLAHRFVPGHPMAGTEGSGLTAADPGLFRGAAWVLCPLPEGEISRFRWLARLIIEVFGARLVPVRERREMVGTIDDRQFVARQAAEERFGARAERISAADDAADRERDAPEFVLVDRDLGQSPD